jgi:hypothetical protein
VLLQLPLPLLLLSLDKVESQYFMRNPTAFWMQQSACPMIFGMLKTSLINVTQYFDWVGEIWCEHKSVSTKNLCSEHICCEYGTRDQ